MPPQSALAQSLRDLLGREVEATPADLDLDGDELYTGILLDDEDGLAGAIVADLELACVTGGSLVMLPEQTVASAIGSGELEDNLRENYYEVANILSALVNGPAVKHIRLGELVDGVPSEIRDLVLRAPGRCDFAVSVPGYGDGKISFVAT